MLIMCCAIAAFGCGAPMLTRTTDTVRPLKMQVGQRVQVEHFTLDNAKLPEKTDDWYKDWNVDLSQGLAQGIVSELNRAGFQAVAVTQSDAAKSAYTIKGKYIEVAAGSKGARGAMAFVGGYTGDAGKAFMIIEGVVVDQKGRTIMTFYNKEVPPQNFATDASGAFSDAIAKTSERFANEFKDRVDD